MYVKDYDFIYNVDALFQKEVIIYGAGQYGKRTADLLDDLEVSFCCFCDKNRDKKEYLGHPVISIEELKEKTDKEECFIIIGSTDYSQEISEELQQNQIRAFVCTGHGLRVGIGLNLEHKKIPKEFAADFKRRKEIWEKNIKTGVNSNLCVDLCRMPEPILVYQPGKVASTTIYKTLLSEKLDVIHFVRIFTDLISTGKSYIEQAAFDEEMIYLFNQMQKRKNGIKIVTAVREPVARALSQFMQGYGFDFVSGRNPDFHIEKNALSMVTQLLEEDYEFQWFDKELKKLTGIDIFDYPFDKEHGYAWIKKDDIEILVLKAEKLNENVNVLGEFAGRPDMHIVNDNVGGEKLYKYIYEELKRRIKIPNQLIEQQFKYNKRLEHFYTESEKEGFMKKWKIMAEDNC